MASRRDENNAGDWRASIRQAGPYLGLGIQLAGAMAFFTVGGYFLDGWLGTTPWITVAGAVLGMASVFAQIFRMSESIGRLSGNPKTRREDTGPSQR